MRRIETATGGGFRVLAGTPRSQAARMVLAPGETTGGPDNRHEKGDQWLVVVAGTGSATVEGREVPLGPGDLLLIEAGERHAVHAGESEPLRTVNVYAPPEY